MRWQAMTLAFLSILVADSSHFADARGAKGSHSKPAASKIKINPNSHSGIEIPQPDIIMPQPEKSFRESFRELGLDFDKWQINHSGEEAKIDFIQSLGARVLGGRPEVAFFLDPVIFRTQLTQMKIAWDRSSSELPQKDLLDQFFTSISGKYLFVVGHIEGQNFVKRSIIGEVEQINITSLIESAATHNVLVFPLGCRSIEAGVPVGFSRNITTTEVSKILRAIPDQPRRIADLLKPFELLGEASLNLDLTGKWIEATIRKYGEIDSENAEAHFRFPRCGSESEHREGSGCAGCAGCAEGSGSGSGVGGEGMPAPSSLNQSRLLPTENSNLKLSVDYDEFLREHRNLAEAGPPWYLRGSIKALVQFVKDDPITSYIISTLFFMMVASSFSWISKRPILLRQRSTAWIVRVAFITELIFGLLSLAMIGLGALVMLVGLVYFIFAMLTNDIGAFFYLVGVLFLAILFSEKNKKDEDI